MAVCGGVNCIIEPRVFVALSKAKMISPDGTSKPFSNRGDGYGRGEGCGVVFLKPLKKVRACRIIISSLSYSVHINDQLFLCHRHIFRYLIGSFGVFEVVAYVVLNQASVLSTIKRHAQLQFRDCHCVEQC